ncbi:MAG: ABC transporter substrate-binding protein, partial [Candidatus Rokuibacteriota bacterium]
AAGLAAPLAGIGHPPLSWDEVAGTWVSGWHSELERFSARELNSRFRRRFGRRLDTDGWAAWAALKMLAEGVVRAEGVDTPSLIRYFESAPRFDGHKGEALTFRAWDHQLGQPVYVLDARKREPGSERREPLGVVAQVPAPGEALDAIGVGKEETPCRF